GRRVRATRPGTSSTPAGAPNRRGGRSPSSPRWGGSERRVGVRIVAGAPEGQRGSGRRSDGPAWGGPRPFRRAHCACGGAGGNLTSRRPRGPRHAPSREEPRTVMETESYDLIVIGSGPAGEKGAAQAAYFGKKVALVEKEPVLGGTAANTGTLPSKTLRETALLLSEYRNREPFGLEVKLKGRVTLADFLGR